MTVAVYTSLAINYLAKARVLAKSLKSANPSIYIVAIICDRMPAYAVPSEEPFDEIWSVENYPSPAIKGWIFRHNIMELCTAVKGWGLTVLLERGFSHVMYLDPDCWILRDPADLIEMLPADYSVGVVPHTTRPADSDEEIRIVETSSLRHGIYNLGFLLVRNDVNGQKLARWWAQRLARFCVDDFERGLFTDQRWFDLATGYFDFIKVMRHPGLDVASWNVGQRVLTRDGDSYSIDGQGLYFYHFSGVGPASVHRWVRDKFAPTDPLAAELEFRYEALIAANGQENLAKIRPRFNFYDDGAPVHKADRALYRERADLEKRFADPYAVDGAEHFRQEAKAIAGGDHPNVPKRSPDEIEQLARCLFEPLTFQRSQGLSEQDDEKLWAAYKTCAWDEGVPANRFLESNYYRLEIDTTSNFQTPLHHYVGEGCFTGVSPCWIYDDVYYLTAHPDVRDAVRDGWYACGFHHFLSCGAEEGRDGCLFFNEHRYLSLHKDVARAVESGAFRSGEQHYTSCGHQERRAV